MKYLALVALVLAFASCMSVEQFEPLYPKGSDVIDQVEVEQLGVSWWWLQDPTENRRWSRLDQAARDAAGGRPVDSHGRSNPPRIRWHVR